MVKLRFTKVIMAEIIELGIENGMTCLDIEPDKLLNEAVGKLQSVVIIGVEHDGTVYNSTSHGHLADTVLDIEIFKAELIEIARGEEE